MKNRHTEQRPCSADGISEDGLRGCQHCKDVLLNSMGDVVDDGMQGMGFGTGKAFLVLKSGGWRSMGTYLAYQSRISRYISWSIGGISRTRMFTDDCNKV